MKEKNKTSRFCDVWVARSPRNLKVSGSIPCIYGERYLRSLRVDFYDHFASATTDDAMGCFRNEAYNAFALKKKKWTAKCHLTRQDTA